MKYKPKHSTLAKIWRRIGENAVFPVPPSNEDRYTANHEAFNAPFGMFNDMTLGEIEWQRVQEQFKKESLRRLCGKSLAFM